MKKHQHSDLSSSRHPGLGQTASSSTETLKTYHGNPYSDACHRPLSLQEVPHQHDVAHTNSTACPDTFETSTATLSTELEGFRKRRPGVNISPPGSLEVSESFMSTLIFMHVANAARVKPLIITLLPAGIVIALVVVTCPRLARQLLSLSCADKL